MKKIYSIIGATAICFGLNAQSHRTAQLAETAYTPANGAALKTMSTATLTPPQYSASCFTTQALYYADGAAPRDSGFISGINAYGDLEKAQKYTVTGTVHLTGAIVVSHAHGTSSITLKAYNVNTTTGAPGTTTLGSSNSIMLNSFNSGSATTFSFATMPNVSNMSFFVSAVLPATPASVDTFGIYTEDFSCTGSDSLAWEKWNDNSWNSFSSVYGGALDLAILPIVDIATGIDNISKNDLSLFKAFPNPASGEVTINYSLSKASNVDIEVYDINGKLVKTISEKNAEVGQHNTKIDISALEAGVYMYGVKTDNAKLFSKFTVTK